MLQDGLCRATQSNPGDESRERVFGGYSRAYERTSLIVTTNLPFESWTEVLGSQRLTGALLDRLNHRVHILEANGESYLIRDMGMSGIRMAPSDIGLTIRSENGGAIY